MKFRLLLWLLGLLLARASRNKTAFREQLLGRDLVFQLQTLDGKSARHFIVKDQRISSRRGLFKDPALAIAFKNASCGAAALTAKNRQLAFMQGIQDKTIQIQGNPALALWFLGLAKHLARQSSNHQKAA
jgi:hypothetical protein